MWDRPAADIPSKTCDWQHRKWMAWNVGVDSLTQWWSTITLEQRIDIELIQIKVDNGPESSGIRTQFLKRIVEFVDLINTPKQVALLSSLP